MKFSIVQILSDQLIKAVCATLIHSLWQGVLLAAVAGVIVMCTRTSTSLRRYYLLVAALLGFALTVTFTFITEFTASGINAWRTNLAESTTLPNASPVAEYNKVFDFFINQANTIFLIWLLIVGVKTAQLLTGLRGLQVLRKSSLIPIDQTWQAYIDQLANKMGIKRMVRLAESAIASAPMVIGHLKPLILMPVGLITALSTADIEAILVHELAHIRRRDYLINLVLKIMEIVFFFNPAILWIGTLISTERENCCDDIAVKHSRNKVGYIRALMACQEYQSIVPKYAIALNGSQNQLVVRVKRLLSNHNPTLNVMEKSMLGVGLFIFGLFIVTFSNAEKIDSVVSKASKAVVAASKSFLEEENAAIVPVAQSCSPPCPVKKSTTAAANKFIEKERFNNSGFTIYQPAEVGDQTFVAFENGDVQTQLTKLNGILYQINIAENNVVSLQVDGKTVPQNKINTYLFVIDSLQIPKIADESIKPTMLVYPKVYMATPEPYEKMSIEYKADSTNRYEPYSANYSTKTGVERVVGGPNDNTETTPLTFKKNYRKDGDVPKQLLNMMISDGIANAINSYKLSETELIVNNKKIAEDDFRQFKSRNIKNIRKGSTIYYNYTINTSVNKPRERKQTITTTVISG
jgi:bla regulator protein BlaR1